MKTKKKEKTEKKPNDRRSNFLKAISGNLLLVLLGLLLILCPDLGAAAVGLVAGWILVGVGAVGVLMCVLSWPLLGFGSLILSVAAAGFGIYLLINPLTLASFFGVAAGIYLLLDGLGSLLECRMLKKFGYGYVFNTIIAVLLTLLGIALLFAPLTASQIVATLLGIGMMVCGGMNMFLRAWAAGKLSQPKKDPTIVDADE